MTEKWIVVGKMERDTSRGVTCELALDDGGDEVVVIPVSEETFRSAEINDRAVVTVSVYDGEDS